MYFSPQATILRGADPARWGIIATPRGGVKSLSEGFKCLLDNGCFNGNWQEDVWLAWLDNMAPHQARCIMATAPDVVGDAQATLERFAHYAPMLRRRNWRVGLVAQDGLESLDWPTNYDALFIGGTTTWKLSSAADWCIQKARRKGKWIHVGRANSQQRIRHFDLLGVDSCDGTYLVFNPREGFERLGKQLAQRPLFHLG